MKKFFSWILVMSFAVIIASTMFTGCQREAASFPSRPITCIVPFGVGGGSDVLVRAVMGSINLPNGRPMVAVNVEGAVGFVGGMQAFNSAADGYTIFTHNPSSLLTFYHSGQDPIPIFREATTIALLLDDYLVLSTNRTAATEFGWETIDDVVEWARANPDQRIRAGVAGAMNMNMITLRRIARDLGIFDSFIFAPYDGGTAVRVANMQNEVQLALITVSEMAGVVASGDFIPLLVVNDARIGVLPDTPTTLEKGLEVINTLPRGFFGPRGMNPEHVRIIADALRVVANDPGFRETMENLGFDVVFRDSADAEELIRRKNIDLTPHFQELLGG